MKKIIKETKKIGKYAIEEKYLYFLSAVVSIAALGLMAWFGFSYASRIHPVDEDNFSDVTSNDEKKDCKFTRGIDGACVNLLSEENPKLVGVMVENHLDARPQSGISKASVVYEAPVEANYSRFLLIYPLGDEVAKVGPVRSARSYYLDWVSEFDDIMYMHVGGSPEALNLIDEYGLFDLNEFYHGWYYWRSEDRYAPHNVYTSNKLWEKAWEDDKLDIIQDSNNIIQSVDDIMQTDGWKFENNQESCLENCVDEITISFLPPVYEAVWKYSTSTQQYERFQLGKPHVDQDGSTMYADTIAVQYVETQVLDTYGRLAMDTIGEGKTSVFRNGFEIQGIWKKSSRTDKTRFFDESGNEIFFKPGKIWIEVVNQRGEVVTNLDKIQD